MGPHLSTCVLFLPCLLMFFVVPSGATRCVTGGENNCTNSNSCKFNGVLYCCKEHYDVYLSIAGSTFDYCECSRHTNSSYRFTCVLKSDAKPFTPFAWLTCGLALMASWLTAAEAGGPGN